MLDAVFGIGSGTSNATGMVTAVPISIAGSGYFGTSDPSVTIAAPPGSGTTATATAVRSTSVVTALTKTASGSGYEVVPALTVTGGAGGSGCTGHVTLAATTVDRGVVVLRGDGYAGPPTVTVSGGGGTGATMVAVMGADTAPVAAGGSGYSAGDILTLVGGTGTAATLTVTSRGNYTATGTNPLGVTGGTGTGATFAVTYRVESLTTTANGSNYTSPPTVTIASPGSGTTATATSRLTGTTVATVVRDTSGSGYRDFPAVTIAAPTAAGGTTATATATINTVTVASVTVTDPGTGYVRTGPPTVTIAAPASGTTATATATVTNQACVPYPSAGTYTMSFAPPSGVAGFTSGTFSTGFLSCDGARHAFNPGPSAISNQATISSTYVCLQGTPLPIKKQLFVTIGGVTVTLNNVNNSTYLGGTADWTGTANIAQSQVWDYATHSAIDCSGGGSTAFAFTLRYSVTTHAWTLSYSWHAASCGSQTPVAGNSGCGDWYPVNLGSESSPGSTTLASGTGSQATFTSQPFNCALTVPSGTRVGGLGCPTIGSPPANYGTIAVPFTGTFTVTE